MIGILFIVGIILWFTVAVMLSTRIPGWVGIKKDATAFSFLLFPLVLTAPIADELIGRWQFSRLCEREAVVTLSPDWEKVKRAGKRGFPIVPLEGYFIQILSQRMEYFDADTGMTFLTNQAFHANGGFLAYQLGLGLGGSTACWPKDDNKIYKQVNLDELINQGKLK